MISCCVLDPPDSTPSLTQIPNGPIIEGNTIHQIPTNRYFSDLWDINFVSWRSGFNGGSQQKFRVAWLNIRNQNTKYSPEIMDSGLGQTIQYIIKSLEPSTIYNIYVEATNKRGVVKSGNVNCITRSKNSQLYQSTYPDTSRQKTTIDQHTYDELQTIKTVIAAEEAVASERSIGGIQNKAFPVVLIRNTNSADKPSHGRTRREIKLANYDGTSEWSDFKSHFDACAVINNWDDQEKGLYLATALRGQAQGVFSDLPTEKRMDYTTLIKALQERFSPPNQTELYRVQLKERRQKASESLPELGQP
ncbi:unnamed protein product [Mytilus edulis]|uniref:Fibronectin type-III domain-containing protein n=1 Tax=Mytilus edulis TaxID=6550 RepID=A0A8S3V4M9_MYTED|nr:unnamed protein product [Mytilus edulis]